MDKPLYALRDDKAKLFNPPFTAPNDQVATRQFGDVVTSREPNLITAHPGDFSLHFIGSFNETTGVLTPVDGGTVILARGSDFVVFVDSETKAK